MLIPIEVLRDQNITDFAKVLYAQIADQCLTGDGFCRQTNSDLAEIFHKDKLTISRAISQLVNAGHINYQIDKEGGNIRLLWIDFPFLP